MKKILAIYYTQSGQLGEIIDNFLKPLSEYKPEIVQVQPKQSFPFPWSGKTFFDVMPESVLEEGIEIEPLQFKEKKYDLIIVGYQPWYLSPAPPVISFLKDPDFCAVMKDTPVVTVIGSRNMWLNAQMSVRNYIKKAGGSLVGNVPLIDRHSNLISVVTILHWMLSGKKDRYLNIFPKPGISEDDIQNANLFGEKVKEALIGGVYTDLQKSILSLKRINISITILFIEQRAKRLFKIWANLVKNKGTTPRKRALWVRLYSYYLVIALFVVTPLVLAFYFVFFVPFTLSSIKRKKAYFCGIGEK